MGMGVLQVLFASIPHHYFLIAMMVSCFSAYPKAMFVGIMIFLKKKSILNKVATRPGLLQGARTINRTSFKIWTFTSNVQKKVNEQI